ncbi:MAG: hypothetical protein NVSMB31_18480 [Vulcanimicrobiaceae bacterium]
MNLFVRMTGAVAAAAIIGAGAAPAGAVLATDYIAPKLAQMGKSSVPIAGSGVVLVKVLVKADGSFDVIKVFKSNNPGDNAAALDIARHSTYHVGLKGGKPTTAFYDFTLKFVGKSLSSNQGDSSSSGGSGVGAIRDLLQSGKYAGAKAAATAYLASKPNDVLAQTYLAIADAFLNDDVAGAQAFDKVASIPKKYQILAAQTYSLAAVQMVKTDPSQALLYAKKSLAIHADGNAYFALGVAQLATKDAASALVNLKKASEIAKADPKTTTKEKISIDSELLQAYVALNDQPNVAATAAEIKQLDPTSPVAARVVAQQAYDQAAQLSKDGKYADAVKQFEAGAQADPESAVTGYANAALVMSKVEKPDFKAMSAEADKALAAKADDPLANYAKGVALVNIAVSAHDDAGKKSGIVYLNKADTEAKAAGMVGLSLAIENFVKSIK